MYTSIKGKRNKIPLIISFTVCFAVLVTVYFFVVQNLDSQKLIPSDNTTQQQGVIKQVESSTGSPVRIIIPKINVDAVLEYVGLTPEGEMEEPTESDNAAWYNSRPLPGEVGTSVIAGHFGFKDNKPAVFDKLHKLRKGDEIYIKDSKGAVVTFVVQDLKDYVPEQDATDVFGSSDGKSHLNLITCKGAWNESLKSYDTRLVVFTDRI